MKLKTTFWNNEGWRERTENLAFKYGTITTLNILIGIIINNWILTIINLLPMIGIILLNQSLKKWKQEQKEK